LPPANQSQFEYAADLREIIGNYLTSRIEAAGDAV
jgi:hypothetical protein